MLVELICTSSHEKKLNIKRDIVIPSVYCHASAIHALALGSFIKHCKNLFFYAASKIQNVIMRKYNSNDIQHTFTRCLIR